MKKRIGNFCFERIQCGALRNCCLGLLAFVSLVVFPRVAEGESFIAPYGGNLYLQCVGGSAGATTQFGIGSSPTNFTVYLSNLPAACPDSEVLVGPVKPGANNRVWYVHSMAWPNLLGIFRQH